MSGWLTACFRALVVLVLGCAALVVLGFIGRGPVEITLLAVGVPRQLFESSDLPLAFAAVIVAAQAVAVLLATKGHSGARWALLGIAVATTATRIASGAATGELAAAAAYSAVWLLLAGLLFLPSSTDWFADARAAREARR